MNDKKRILQILRRDARLSFNQIAERLQLAREDVERIIQDCEKTGIIRGYSTLIDEETLPETRVHALIEVSVTPERDSGFDRLARTISKFSAVTDVLLISGNYDLLVVVEGDNLQQVAAFVAVKLSPLEGVRSTRTHFMLKKYKESGVAFQNDEKCERLKVTP